MEKKALLIILYALFGFSVLCGLLLLFGGEPASGLVLLAIGIIGLLNNKRLKNYKPEAKKEKAIAKEVNEATGNSYNKEDYKWFDSDETLDFYVAGVRHENRQELLKSDLFEPSGSGITLAPEPDNPHDPNAIKVVHHAVGCIGYVPANFTDEVRDYIKDFPKYDIFYKSRESNDTIFVDVFMQPKNCGVNYN